jgi:hypothetical protein
MRYKDIYDYVTIKENEYAQAIDINGWQWSMVDHIKTSFYYQHGRLLNGNDEDTPVINITRPLTGLQMRAENIDVKDITIYVDEPDSAHLSFLIKKYHDDVFVVENDIDTFLNEVNESKVVYGGGLAKKMDRARPEVIPLQSIAFCDQTNLLGAPVGFKHDYNPDELLQMADMGWGQESNGANITLQQLVDLADESKVIDKMTGMPVKSTTKTIKVYEIHGSLPVAFLDDSDNYSKFKYQLHIVAFYHTSDGKQQGVTLFRKAQKEGNLKLLLRDKIYNRALGFGGAEELFEQQVWSTWSVIQQKNMLEAASKVILKSTDPTLSAKHPTGLKGLDNLSILNLQQGADMTQVDTTPRAYQLFTNFESALRESAQTTSGATDALLGKNPSSGTPFKLQDLVTQEGQGQHEYRRMPYAKFIESVYMDWLFPYIVNEITKGTQFMSELSVEEMQYVVSCVVRNASKQYVYEQIVSGKDFNPDEVKAFEARIKEEFMQGGNKRFLETLAGEFKNKPLKVKVNVAGKQKNLSAMTDKLVNIFRMIFANPQGFQAALQIPGMAKNWNEILEYSGLTPGDFSLAYQQAVPSPIQQQQLAAPGGQTSVPQLDLTAEAKQ